MRPVPPPPQVEESFFPVKLYLDDLEYFEVIAGHHGVRWSWSDSEYEFDDLEEVRRVRGQHPKRLALTLCVELPDGARGAHALVGIRDTFASIRAGRNDFPPELRRAISRRLSRCTKDIPKYLVVSSLLVGIAMVVAIAILLQLNSTGHVQLGTWWMGALTATTLAVAFVATALVFRTMTGGISLKRRHEGGFLKRRRDEILAGIIIALVSWLLGRFSRDGSTDTPSRTGTARDTSAPREAKAKLPAGATGLSDTK